VVAEEKPHERHHSFEEAEDDGNSSTDAAVHARNADADSCGKV
jgi:hypothetical protein